MKRVYLILVLLILMMMCAVFADTSMDVYYLVVQKDLDGIKQAVQNGADINSLNPYDDKQQTPLLRAISYGYIDPVYVEIAEYLIKQGAELDNQDKEGFTALHYASSNGHLELVKLLLERGVANNIFPDETKFYKGQTPLSGACNSTGNNDKNLEIVKLLLEKGASLEKNPLSFQSPLTAAINSKGIKTSEYLLEQGADPNVPNDNNQYPLYLAIDKGLDNAFLSFLLQKGANPNKCSDYYTPLEMAMKKRNVDLAQMLVDAGADINYVDDDGDTLLHSAAKVNSNKNMTFLLEKGLDINARNNAGETPLHIVTEKGYDSVAEQLIENGADLFALDNKGYMPMHIQLFVYKSDKEKVQWLLSKGVDVNMNQVEDKMAPLHLAAGYGNLEMVQFLIEKGADINIRADGGYTPLHAAVSKNGKAEVVNFLLSKGVQVDVENDEGQTPLFEAVMAFNDEEIVNLLLSKGADINHVDKLGKTLVHYAAEEKWDGVDMINWLSSKGADLHIKDNDGNLPIDYAATEEIKEILK